MIKGLSQYTNDDTEMESTGESWGVPNHGQNYLGVSNAWNNLNIPYTIDSDEFQSDWLEINTKSIWITKTF